MEDFSTITVKELVGVLKTLPQNAKVYMSIDEEGNGYGTLHLPNTDGLSSFSHEQKDNVVLLYPWDERLDYETICPLENAVFEEEFRQIREEKNNG